jgi:hypothetical protein
MIRVSLVIVLLALACQSPTPAEELFSNWPTPAEVSIKLGSHSVVIPNDRGGLRHFPDMPICVLRQRPLSFLMVCGDDTYLWGGPSLREAMPVAHVLAPGAAGSVDNHYVGIASVHQDTKRKRLVAFYHAEDGEGIEKNDYNGVQGFYGSVCVAESPLDTVQFTKLGPAITADQPKKLRGKDEDGGAWMAQGVGDPSVCVDAEGDYLLCVYGEFSNRLKRGVQLCVARATIDSAGRPGSWTKFNEKSFSQPGVGGHETPVISAWPLGDTIDPHIQYVRQWHRYVMVFEYGSFSEIGAAIKASNAPVADCGIYLTTSKDGTMWAKPIKVKTVFNIYINGYECIMHPFLVISRATSQGISGDLMYGYTPKWPENPQVLGASPIQITLNSEPVRSVASIPKTKTSTTPTVPLPVLALTFDSQAPIENHGAKSVQGKVGKALQFDGKSYVSVAGEFPSGNMPRTLSVWLKNTRGPVGRNIHVINYGPWAQTKVFGIMEAGGKWRFFDWGGGLDSGVKVDQNWHHHCLTYDGRQITYYLDGDAVSNVECTLATSAKPLILGTIAPNATDYGYDGLIDELAIYDKALGADQVQQLRQLGMQGKHPGR